MLRASSAATLPSAGRRRYRPVKLAVTLIYLKVQWEVYIRLFTVALSLFDGQKIVGTRKRGEGKMNATRNIACTQTGFSFYFYFR